MEESPMREKQRSIALLTVGSTFVIGAMWLAMHYVIKAKPPTASDDFAAWFQVLATMLSIGVVYIMGVRQGEHDQRARLRQRRDDERKEQAGYRQIVTLLCDEVKRLNIDAQEKSDAELVELWNVEYRNSLGYALQLFDAIPVQRLEMNLRIVQAFSIRNAAKRIQTYGERYLSESADPSAVQVFRSIANTTSTMLIQQVCDFGETYAPQ